MDNNTSIKNKIDSSTLQQLRSFGYSTNKIIEALKSVKNKKDINQIIDSLEKQRENEMPNKYPISHHPINHHPISRRRRLEENKLQNEIDKMTKEAPKNSNDEHLSILMVSVKKETKSLCDHCDGEICDYLSRLLQTMYKYNKHKFDDSTINESFNGLETLNDFLHLLDKHQTDIEFEFISSSMGFCDIKNCVIFKRNTRNRSKNDQKSNYLQQIMDKIHCCYQHCYDIGNRLRFIDKTNINNDEKMREDDECEDCLNYLMDKTRHQIHQFLCSKRQNLPHHQLLNVRNQKYNQLFVKSEIEEKNKNNNDDKNYDFGVGFLYDFEGEDFSSTDTTEISPKYKDLKEEMLTNTISSLSPNQFDNEYKKADIHWNSDYRRETYQSKKEMFKECKEIIWSFSIQHILSLMIYSNHTSLQYEFSKTYRKKFADYHYNFYHLGKYLKISVKKFGNKFINGTVKSLYHGISEPLLFSTYIGDEHGVRNGISILCPLSTSSSFAVAAHFSNYNGLIVEFGGDYKYCDARYFSVEWLSDYANESEYFFIQNTAYYERLEIVNIFDGKSGHCFDIILKTLNIIEKITEGYNLSEKEKLMFTYSNNKELIIKILHNKNDHFFVKYAHKMIDTYYKNKISINIDYLKMKSDYSFLFDLFCCSKTEMIKLKEINILFPNIEKIWISNIKLCCDTLNNIWGYLKNVKQTSKLREIRIATFNKNSDLTVSNALFKFSKKFKKLGTKIKKDNHWLFIQINNIKDGCSNNPIYDVECQFFLTAGCKKGNHCPYKHMG